MLLLKLRKGSNGTSKMTGVWQRGGLCCLIFQWPQDVIIKQQGHKLQMFSCTCNPYLARVALRLSVHYF